MHQALDRIEWEVLKDKIIISNLTSLGELPEGSKRIEVLRDESYKINAKVYGTMTNNDHHNSVQQQHIPGTIVSGFTVEGTDGTYIYTLNGCYITNVKQSHNLTGEDYATTFEVEIIFSELMIEVPLIDDRDWLAEWYLNGPNDSIPIFPRSTKRSFSQKYNRERLSVDRESHVYPGERQENCSRDFAFIDAGEIKYILSKVPQGLGPDWSNNICIEYRREWGEIPPKDKREAVAEITSFIIGKHLLNTGYSVYDTIGQQVEQVASNPWGDNVVALCQSHGLSPIRFTWNDYNRLERVLSQIVPKYLELRNKLDLSEALWRYWIASSLSVGVNLPILHAGVEILAKAWFRSNKSKTKGVYIPKKEFEKLIADGMDIIRPKLSGQVYGDRMTRKISSAYQMTQSEQLAFYFEELCLEVGDVENKALQGRNIMAHGSSGQTDQEISYIIYLTRCYQSLFHRILLKILGYAGEYIDYSAEGWPNRQIDKALEGNSKF